MRIRKAVLTAGGRATRLRPITSTINKHLLPLANKPMIFHAIEKLAAAGMAEIFINTNPGDLELPRAVGDGSRWGVGIRCFPQTGGPQGLAHAIAESKKFIGDEPFVAYLGDNILLGSVEEMLELYDAERYDCLLALAQVEDPKAFGVPRFDGSGRLVEIVEKPADPPSNLAVIGIYIYGPKMFFNAFSQIKKSARGEYEISDVHTALIKSGKRVGYKEITGWWKDTGKPEDLLMANKLLLEQKGQGPNAGDGIEIGEGSALGQGVRLIGPIIIGADCVLENCTIGPNVTVGQGSRLAGATVRDSILLDEVVLLGRICLEQSILGKGARVVSRQSGILPPAKIIIGDKTVIEL